MKYFLNRDMMFVYSVAPSCGGKNTNSRFFVRSVSLFRSLYPAFSLADVDTYGFVKSTDINFVHSLTADIIITYI